jgi:hypothetical protein
MRQADPAAGEPRRLHVSLVRFWLIQPIFLFEFSGKVDLGQILKVNTNHWYEKGVCRKNYSAGQALITWCKKHRAFIQVLQEGDRPASLASRIDYGGGLLLCGCARQNREMLNIVKLGQRQIGFSVFGDR